MITLKSGQTNYGSMYPDVNYNGVQLIGRWPVTGFNPGGMAGLSLTDPTTLALLAVAGYFAYKNRHKFGL